MFYAVESDYSDTNFKQGEKQLSIYRPEVFPIPLVMSLPGHIPEKSDRKKSSTHLNPKGNIWKREERQKVWNKANIRPQLKLEVWM